MGGQVWVTISAFSGTPDLGLFGIACWVPPATPPARAAATFAELWGDLAPVIGLDPARIADIYRSDTLSHHSFVPPAADEPEPARRAAYALRLLDALAPHTANIDAASLAGWAETPALATDHRPWWTSTGFGSSAAVGYDPAKRLAVDELLARTRRRRLGRRPVIERLLSMPHRWLDPAQVGLVELELDDLEWNLAMLLADHAHLSLGGVDPAPALIACAERLERLELARVLDRDGMGLYLGRGPLLRRVAERTDLPTPFEP